MMNTKLVHFNFDEYYKFNNRKITRYMTKNEIITPIELKISRLIFASESGSVLSNLKSNINLDNLTDLDHVISLALTTLTLSDPYDIHLRFIEAEFFGNNVFVLSC